jgi:DNA-binding GntR family transcriptional regulator
MALVAGKLRYQQVMDLVQRFIAERELGPGDLLPPRAELAAMAGVSLITVRRALDELERAGRVTSHQGVGTFVARSRIMSEPGHPGALLSTLQGDATHSSIATRVLGVTQGTPSAALASALRLSMGQRAWRVTRLREIGGEPTIVEEAIIPVYLAPDLDRRGDALSGSLYGLLERVYGLADAHEEQFLSITIPSVAERRLLGLSRKSRVARLRGVTFGADGVPFDCFQHVYPADEFVFYISGQTARHVFKEADLEAWDFTPQGLILKEADDVRERR